MEDIDNRDELISLVADSLNKDTSTGDRVAYFLEGPENDDIPTTVTDWISTGSSVLDVAISNRKYGGVPIGRVTEVSGLESSGKSLLVAHILANTQKKGGIAIYMEGEVSAYSSFLKAIGVDLNKMIYIHVTSIEQMFSLMDQLVSKIREKGKDRLVTIAVDSIAGIPTKSELEGTFDREGYATDKAILMSKGMRKITGMIGEQKIALIFTNQLRSKLGISWGDNFVTPGGHALAFHSSVRIRLKQMAKIKKTEAGKDKIIGIQSRAYVVKNRIGPPYRHADFNIFFDSGIDDYGGWLTVLKDYNLIDKDGKTSYILRLSEGVEIDGEKEFKFNAKKWLKVIEENEKLREYVYNMICEKMIMRYRSLHTGIDEIKISENEDDE